MPWPDVTTSLSAFLRVLAEARRVERVRHGAHELPCRIARQLRVRVQSNHVPDFRKDRRRADDAGKAVPIAVAQQRVQVRELAALALLSHPQACSRIPTTGAVQQVEHAGPRRVAGFALIVRCARRCGQVLARSVLEVQLVDPRLCQPQQRFVGGQRFLTRVRIIGQQGEMQVRIAVGEKPDFEGLDQFLDVARAGDHGGNHDQRPRLRRNAPGIIHSRQRVRVHQPGSEPVHDADRQLAGGEQRQHDDQRQQVPGLRLPRERSQPVRRQVRP